MSEIPLSRESGRQIVETVSDMILASPKEAFSAISAGLCIGTGNLPEAEFASLIEFVGEQSGPPELIKQGAAAVEFLRESRRVDLWYRRGEAAKEMEAHHAIAAAHAAGELCADWQPGDVPLSDLIRAAFFRGSDAKSRGTETCEAQTKAGDDLATPYEDAAAAAGLPLRTILQAAFARGVAAQTANPFQP